MSALLALLSSVLWGISDFLGGTASRRLPVPTVVGVSQLVGLILLVILAVATGALDTDGSYLVPALGAGAAGVVALGMFFRALSIGTMGVVAPVAALGVTVPVIVGIAQGEHPSMVQGLGIAVAVVGVVLASGPELSGEGGGGAQALLLALGAALGFGTVLVLVAEASDGADSGAVVMTLITMRVTSVALVALVILSQGGRGFVVRRSDLPLLALIGAADAGANALYAVASRSALVSVTAVLASLYPVVTALLAYRVHGERLRQVQVAGVGVTLAGVALLAGG
jgi:drug/metabolite transporter (DMT)-like permease